MTQFIRQILFLISIYIFPQLPWNVLRRYIDGKKFVRNFSGKDAHLYLWNRGQEYTDEMIVMDRHYEFGFMFRVFEQYNIRNKRILDVGSTGSVLPIYMAERGNRVSCIDVVSWPLQYKNVKILRKDVLRDRLPKQKFDIITCLSTIEHFGLGRYKDSMDIDGDIKGMEILHKLLKKEGLLFLTTAYGKPTVYFPMHRVYDDGRLQRLTKDFAIIEQEFYGPIDRVGVFRPCSKQEAQSVDTATGHYAIICSVLRPK